MFKCYCERPTCPQCQSQQPEYIHTTDLGESRTSALKKTIELLEGEIEWLRKAFRDIKASSPEDAYGLVYGIELPDIHTEMLHLSSSQMKDGISERAVVLQNGELIPIGDGKLEAEIDRLANTIENSVDSPFRENGDTDCYKHLVSWCLCITQYRCQ